MWVSDSRKRELTVPNKPGAIYYTRVNSCIVISLGCSHAIWRKLHHETPVQFSHFIRERIAKSMLHKDCEA